MFLILTVLQQYAASQSCKQGWETGLIRASATSQRADGFCTEFL